MGTFTADGALETSGTTEMDVTRSGDFAHCSQTLTSPRGSLTILSDCQFSTMKGTWHIISGTGHYSHLQGNGKLLMTFPGAGVIVIESFSGTIRGNRGHNDDDDNDD